MNTPDDGETICWRVIFYDDSDDDPPMAIEVRTFAEAWAAAMPPATEIARWRTTQKDRATAWFSSGFTRYQPLLVARCGQVYTKIQMLY